MRIRFQKVYMIGQKITTKSYVELGDPNIEAQIFAATSTPMRDVSKISLGPFTNPQS